MWHIMVMGTPPTVQSSMGMSRLLAQAMSAFIPFDVRAPETSQDERTRNVSRFISKTLQKQNPNRKKQNV